MNKGVNIGLIGATGLVGQTFLKIFEEQNWDIKNLVPFASSQSVGKAIRLKNQILRIKELKKDNLSNLDLVFIATGEEVSKTWTPIIAKMGIYVVDNSSAFRLNPSVPLICPEVNAHLVQKDQFAYANPNCSTIQLVVLLNALKTVAPLNSVTVASYQAVSGAGTEALNELQAQCQTPTYPAQVFQKPIAFNAIAQIGSFDEFGFSSEEQKIRKETKKILELPNLKVSAQCVRIPVKNGHGESVWVEFEKPTSKNEVLKALQNQPGLKCTDLATPLEASGSDKVWVSRARQDLDQPNRWLFWVVADNIRKGAATNATQIAQNILSL